MRIAIIGRTEVLFDTMTLLIEKGHTVGAIITSKEAPEYTKTADDFKAFADMHGISFFRTTKITDIVDLIRALPPMDIGVSMNYAGILEQEVLDCFPLGVLNAHGGDLPRYRGNACQAWAILNGEEKIGLCIHRMIGGELDSGDIIARDYIPISLETKVTSVWEWMHRSIPILFLEAVQKLDANPDYILEGQSKDPKDALRCYPRMPQDGQIDWTQDAMSILRLINASNKPYPGAFCYLNGEKVIVWDAKLAPDEAFFGVPGQVADIKPGYIDVLTGRGKLRLLSVEYNAGTTTPDTIVSSIRTRLV